MKIFAIGDLHLSETTNKPMSCFGPKWEGHTQKIIYEWKACVGREDRVLLPGDLSWGMKLEEAYADLKLIDQLPGRKICIKGNHDYWWSQVGQLNRLFDSITFLQNKAVVIGDYGICGTRGWISPDSEGHSIEDVKIYRRELIRMQLSLEDALAKGAKKIWLLLHYPPSFYNEEEPSMFSIIKRYPVEKVIYGHLHDEISWCKALIGEIEGIDYQLVSADYLEFCPKFLGQWR